MDVLSRFWLRLFIDKDEGVVCWVAEIKLHPFPSWMVVIGEHLCLCCDMDSETLEEGRRRADFFFAVFNIRSYHIHEYRNEGEMGDLVKDVVGSG